MRLLGLKFALHCKKDITVVFRVSIGINGTIQGIVFLLPASFEDAKVIVNFSVLFQKKQKRSTLNRESVLLRKEILMQKQKKHLEFIFGFF